MPPVRTMPPAKALKTERTHEENQERAYIAASRRSDRSLEARVESARRASEIHKRRTGRSLRVTEQDVVNEEMYEEEDDDLPMQYRRLTAHLQTGSADFNRRLSAYLTNHVAMRSALDQAITNSYAQQYPNAPQFAHNQSMYPSPFMHQNMPPQRSPTSFQPYPSPGSSSYRPSHPARSSSGSHGTPSYSPTGMTAPSPTHGTPRTDHRRTSASSNQSPSHSPQNTKSTPVMQPRSVADTSSPTSGVKQEDASSQMRAPPQPSPHFPNMNGYPNISTSPFSTSLPAEAQMLLGGALDPHDPMTAMMMAGSEHLPQLWNYPPPSMKARNGFHQSFDGMSATLAPSALDMSHGNAPQYSSPPSSMSMTPSSAMNTADLQAGAYDNNGSIHDYSKLQIFSGNSSTGSGTVTPGGDGSWDAFINSDSPWAEGNVT